VSLRAKPAGVAKQSYNRDKDGSSSGLLQRVDKIASVASTLPRNDTEMKLIGQQQLRNAALAASIARHLKIDDKIIERAVAQTALPCRFEIMQKKPLVILDGAHNPLKIKSVMHNLQSLTYGKLYTMFASAYNKDARQMLGQLIKEADEIILTQIVSQERKFWSATKLAKLIPSFKKKVIDPDPRAALKKALKKLKPQDALLITGSFYLAGELRKHWISEEEILRKRKTN